MAKNEEAPVRFQTPPFVMMWPHLFKAHANNFKDADPDQAPKFEVTAVFDKSKWTADHHTQWKALVAAVKGAAQRELGIPFEKIKQDKRGLRKNVERETSFDFVPDDAPFAKFTSFQKPGVVDRNGVDISPADGNDDCIYSGAYAIATILIKPYKHEKGGKGISLRLNNVMVLVGDPKVAPRRDNRKSAEEDFNQADESAFLENFDIDGVEDEDEPPRKGAGKGRKADEEDDEF